MTREFSVKPLTIPMIGAAALLLTAGAPFAQSRLDATQLSGAEVAADIRAVDGTVVALERRPDMVAMLKLDNGTSLQVAPESQGPGEAVQVGDAVIARYAEVGARDKVATLVRVIETQAP
ncbi:MAG TPA: hypothetical protein VLK35_12565 [Methylomirabilota bacterium]|nr:hypothetical protein [Methylomirabilota bacterium]